MPVLLVLFFIAFVASTIGAICGIGGGVLIKPILDAAGIMTVSAVSFVSGCTVLAMSATTVGSSIIRKTAVINKRTTPALGVGAAAGGVIGQQLFAYIKRASGNESIAGFVQAILLGLVIIGTLIYLTNKDKLPSRHVKSIVLSVAIGLLLGIFSSFLGIGGGPVNIAVLSFFFSMDMKSCVSNSLCIVLISQTVATLSTIITSSVPEINVLFLFAMMAGGVCGGLLGRRVNKRIDERQLKRLFNGLMIVVICMCAYNAVRFALLFP